MIDLYLKFTDEAQSIDVLYAKKEEVITETDDEGNEQEVIILVPDLTKPLYRNIDTIGVIYEGGEWDAEGNVITEPTALDGWHCNVRVVAGENADALAPYKIDVSTPMRVWG